ncbi:hypothetical protein Tco_1075581 [Tanacetum coccineum]
MMLRFHKNQTHKTDLLKATFFRSPSSLVKVISGGSSEMLIEDGHICSNELDEKAQRAHMFLRVLIRSNEFDEKAQRAHMFLEWRSYALKMGEKEVPLLKYTFHVGEVQTSENHNDDGGDEKEDHDFEPSTDEESDEDLQKIHLMRIWMDI